MCSVKVNKKSPYKPVFSSIFEGFLELRKQTGLQGLTEIDPLKDACAYSVLE